MNTELSEALQASVQRELAIKGYSAENDSVMAEYVTIMLINSKTSSQITAELSELIGDEYDPAFTDWLFKEKQKLERPQSSSTPFKSTSPVQDTTSPIPTYTGQDDTAPRSRHQRPLIQQALSSLPSAPSTQKRTASMRSPSPSGRPSQKKRTHELPDRPKAMREEPTQPRRSLLDRVGAKAPSQDRSDKFGAPQPMPADQPPAFPMMPMGNFNPVMNGFGPNGQPMDPMMALSQLGLAALQLGLVQVPGMPGPSAPLAPLPGPPRPSQDPTAARAAHRGRAQYVAPHLQNLPAPEPTRPTAIKSQEPLSEPPRPQSPSLCKFGVNCTNPSCRWSHPSPVATVESGIVLSADACPDGINCKNKDCTLSHVSKAWNPTAISTTTQSGPKTSTPVLVPCKFGINCTRPNCTFFHPQRQQFSGPSSVPCKFGASCTRADCIYKHPKDRVLPSQFSRGLDPVPPTTITAPAETKNRSVDFRTKPTTALDPSAKEFVPAKMPTESAEAVKNDSVRVDA